MKFRAQKSAPLVSTLVASALAVLVLVGCGHQRPAADGTASVGSWVPPLSASSPVLGEDAPGVIVPPLGHSASYSLARPSQQADLARSPLRAPERGELLVVEFWASWCSGCQPALQDVQDITAEFSQVRAVAVSLDESEGSAKAYARAHGIALPVVWDSGQQLSARYGLRALPASFLVNEYGRVIGAFRGASASRKLRQAVRAHLGPTSNTR